MWGEQVPIVIVYLCDTAGYQWANAKVFCEAQLYSHHNIPQTKCNHQHLKVTWHSLCKFLVRHTAQIILAQSGNLAARL